MTRIVSTGWRTALAALLLGVVAGCAQQNLWHEKALPSGRVVKILAMDLAWGDEHGERIAANDAFSIDYVASVSADEVAAHEREAREVFELIRPISEQWGFRTAGAIGRSATDRRGPFVIYTFRRQPAGDWAVESFRADRPPRS